VQYPQVESDLADLLSEPRGGDPLLLPYRMMMLLWNVSNDSSTIADDIKARAINSLHRSLEQYDLFPVW
jgi:hypothetical protein